MLKNKNKPQQTNLLCAEAVGMVRWLSLHYRTRTWAMLSNTRGWKRPPVTMSVSVHDTWACSPSIEFGEMDPDECDKDVPGPYLRPLNKQKMVSTAGDRTSQRRRATPGGHGQDQDPAGTRQVAVAGFHQKPEQAARRLAACSGF